MKAEINNDIIQELAVGACVTDSVVPGFLARRLDSGRITFALKYTAPATRRQRWLTLGNDLHITAHEARRRAVLEHAKIANGDDPQRLREVEKHVSRSATVDTMLDLYLEKRVRAEKMKSASHIAWCFDKYIRPRLGKIAVRELTRGQIVVFLDSIAEKHGPVMADRLLSYFRTACNWYAVRDEKFMVPFVQGMRHSSPRSRARERILTDPEIRLFWNLSSPVEGETFNTFLRLLLLTGQRRSEVAKMKWADIKSDVWTVPAEDTKTGKENSVYLTSTAQELVFGLPQNGPYIFGRYGRAPLSGFSKAKREFDSAFCYVMQSEVARWTLHDLRRTACSLMARAGVRAEVSERVLNHAVPGMRGIYDRHEYAQEKRLALEALEKQIWSISSAKE